MILWVFSNLNDSVILQSQITAGEGGRSTPTRVRSPTSPWQDTRLDLLCFEAGAVADRELSGRAVAAAATGREASRFDLPRSKKLPALQRGCWQPGLSPATSAA